MAVILRTGALVDAETCGKICCKAFTTLSDRHGFPPYFPKPEIAIGRMGVLLSHPEYYSVVAEMDGCDVGSNFLDERSNIVGIGPITIDPDLQGVGVGRLLMEDGLKRVAERGFSGARLVRAP